MGPSTPDLHQRLLYPQNARTYIDRFDWTPLGKPKFIVLSGGRELLLDTNLLSDEDAVSAALTLLVDVEIPVAMRTKLYERWDQ